MCALWAHGPRSLDTGAPLTTTDVATALESQTTARDLAVEVVQAIASIGCTDHGRPIG